MATPTLDSDDFNRLFGVLAAKLKFINADRLNSAMQAWAEQKSTSIGQILLDQEAITTKEHQLLGELVRKYIQGHATEVQESTQSSVHPAHALIAALRDVNETGIQSALTEVGANTVKTEAAWSTHGEETIASDEEVESSVGRFPIVETLGEGSFGTVFKAMDSRLDRYVAIKVAKPNKRLKVDRFSREAKAAAQLRHQHIVPVHEFGTYGSTKFIVYEYVEGTTLKSALETHGKYDCGKAAETVSKLAAALHYAHERGIVHRDIKPENILIDHQDEPHITDFGLAKRMEEDVEQTIDGSVLGTPAYMSPEQARGERADRRSDIWSLGVILGELIIARKPFYGSGMEMQDHIRHREPTPLRKFDTTISKDIQTIWTKCLEKERDRRFSTAQELADELDRWRRGEPIKSRPIGVFGKATLWIRRNPKEASLLATVFLTIVVAAVVSALFADRAHHERGQRVAELANALLYCVPAEFSNQLKDAETSGVATDELLGELARREEFDPRIGVAQVYYQDSPSSVELNEVITTVLDADSDEECLEILGVLWERHPDLVRRSLAKQHRFRAVGALAYLEASSSKLLDHAFVERLLAKASYERRLWARKLTTARDVLYEHLYRAFRAGSIEGADILAEQFAEELSTLVELIEESHPAQLHLLLAKVRQHHEGDAVITRLRQKSAARRDRGDGGSALANLTVAQLFFNQFADLESPLVGGHDSPLRSLIIDRIAAGRVNSNIIAAPILAGKYEDDPQVLTALLLALGEYDDLSLLALGETRSKVEDRIASLHRTHDDAGVHSAADWLLRRWGQPTSAAGSVALRADRKQSDLDWYLAENGHTMLVLRPSELPEPQFISQGDMSLDQPSRVVAGYPFAISSTEVTVAQFREFLKSRGVEHDNLLQKDLRNSLENGDPRSPVRGVYLVDFSDMNVSVLDYCFWLSQREGLDVVKPGSGSEFQPSQYRGYRIPTGGEWELAAYTGINHGLPFPMSVESALRHAVFRSEAAGPVARLRPNRFGLFDAYGNVAELCYVWSETPDVLAAKPHAYGGSYSSLQVADFRKFSQEAPGRGSKGTGFRIAITVPVETEKPSR